MTLKKIAFLCLLAGAFCACNQGRETNTTVTPAEVSITPFPTLEITVTGLQENTKVPSVTGKPENSSTEVPTESLKLTPTPEPADELIPIDAEHFTSEPFRRFLTAKYDTNQDGFLSQTEREAVKEMEWDSYEILWEGIGTERDDFTEAVLDGFEYFPYLEELSVTNANEVIFKNHPSIRYVGGTEGGIGLLYMENCPSLEFIGGYAYGGSASIINCENLKGFRMRNSDFVSLSFSGCPRLVLDFEEWNSVKNLLLDADAVLTALPYGLSTIRKDGYSNPSGLTYETIKWENAAEQVVGLPEREDFFLKYFDERDFAYMGVQVLEKMEDSYDEQGRKGWNICIDRKIDAYSKTAFSVYTEEQPEPEQIFVRPEDFEEVTILEYSPNRGIAFKVKCDLEVVYRNEAEETLLGTMTESLYWTIGTDGVKRRYASENEWKKNASYVYQAYESLGWK